MNYIYALTDPRDGRVRYVGKSKDPEARLAEHFRQVHSGQNRNPFFCWWIKLLAKNGLVPQVQPIMRVPTDIASEWERHWIAAFRWAGEKLTNLHDGGTGGATRRGQRHTPETRLKMREIALANRENRARAGRSSWLPTARPHPSPLPATNVTKAKMSAIARTRPRRPNGTYLPKQNGGQ